MMCQSRASRSTGGAKMSISGADKAREIGAIAVSSSCMIDRGAAFDGVGKRAIGQESGGVSGQRHQADRGPGADARIAKGAGDIVGNERYLQRRAEVAAHRLVDGAPEANDVGADIGPGIGRDERS